MALLPDVNVLLAARRSDHPAHASSTRWLVEAASGTDPVVVPHVVWTGFLRLVTNPRVFSEPDSLDDALTFVDAVRTAPSVRDLTPGSTTLHRFTEMFLDARATGNLVPDVYLAACAADVGATIVTFDRDFRRIDGVAVLELRA